MSKTPLKKIRFMGLSLGGGKTHRTHLAVLDYFTENDKLFLTHLYRDLGEEDRKSADTHLLEVIRNNSENLQSITVDYPLTTPKCMRCRLVCPGVEKCHEPEIQWMWNQHEMLDEKKRPNKIFTPYTERCVEQYVSYNSEIPVPMDHAFGSNKAPLYARGVFLKKRLPRIKMFEAQLRLSVWRIGRALKISKHPLLYYKNSIDGEGFRQIFLDKFVDQEWLFIYSQDSRHMVRDGFVFDAVMAGYVGFLNSMRLCEPPPKGFPKSETWVLYPKADFVKVR
ncbi:MAG: DUF429 domain-containing protein [Bdellovibrionaceae bacterium]|nr:DUF429 domain-containing protein [Pseudobdellovibrionaceae bacterium]